MNIFFRQDGDAIVADVKFNSGQAGGITFYFKWNAGGKWLASIAASHIQSQLDKHVEKIRETSYQQGWRDAKGKKAKQTYFGRSFGYVKDVK